MSIGVETTGLFGSLTAPELQTTLGKLDVVLTFDLPEWVVLAPASAQPGDLKTMIIASPTTQRPRRPRRSARRTHACSCSSRPGRAA